MQGPIGLSGVQAFLKRGHCPGFFMPRSISPQEQPEISSEVILGTSNLFKVSKLLIKTSPLKDLNKIDGFFITSEKEEFTCVKTANKGIKTIKLKYKMSVVLIFEFNNLGINKNIRQK